MSYEYKIPKLNSEAFGSNRYVATPLRKELAALLKEHNKIIIDFENIQSATQSWVDELLGKFILVEGKVFLHKVKFKNCTDTIQSLIRFVVEERVNDYAETQRKYQEESFLPTGSLQI